MNVYYTVFLVFVVCTSCVRQVLADTHNNNHKGEIEMAELIFEEQFLESEYDYYRSRWSKLPSQGSWEQGYKFENDSTLGKNVMYATWSDGKNGAPNGAYAWRYSILKSQSSKGVSFHGIVKYKDLIKYSGNCHGLHRFGQNWDLGTPGNSSGQILIEPSRVGHYENHLDYGSTSFSKNFFWNWTSPERALTDTSKNGFLEDDVWYELAAYIKPSVKRGSKTAILKLYYRVYGDSNWVELVNRENFYLETSVEGEITQFMIGPYIHNNAKSTTRMYLGFVKLYEGDAIADGTIGNGSEESLVISNHNVETTSTTAILSWDTNKESNTVVDYGSTEARGTLVRGDDNTLKHVIKLADLAPNTTYYYRYSSRTPDGETVMDQENSRFSTKEEDNGGVIEGSLDDLTDVTINNPVEGQVLMYQGGKWINIDARPLVAQLVEEILDETSLVVNKPSA